MLGRRKPDRRCPWPIAGEERASQPVKLNASRAATDLPVGLPQGCPDGLAGKRWGPDVGSGDILNADSRRRKVCCGGLRARRGVQAKQSMLTWAEVRNAKRARRQSGHEKAWADAQGGGSRASGVARWLLLTGFAWDRQRRPGMGFPGETGLVEKGCCNGTDEACQRRRRSGRAIQHVPVTNDGDGGDDDDSTPSGAGVLTRNLGAETAPWQPRLYTSTQHWVHRDLLVALRTMYYVHVTTHLRPGLPVPFWNTRYQPSKM